MHACRINLAVKPLYIFLDRCMFDSDVELTKPSRKKLSLIHAADLYRRDAIVVLHR
jgi:hypothetical protein